MGLPVENELQPWSYKAGLRGNFQQRDYYENSS